MSEFLRRYARRGGGGGEAEKGEARAAPGAGNENRTLLRLAQGASSGYAALSMIGAGASEARALELQAGDELLNAEIEETEGQRQVTRIRRGAMQADAARRVAFAASGVDLQSLSVQQIRREDDRHVQDAIAQTQNRASRAAARRRVFAQRLADRAAETFTGSLLGGASAIVDGVGAAFAAGRGG